MKSRICNNGSPAALNDGRGRFWFANLAGVVNVDPDQLHKNTRMPPVLVEEVVVDNRSLPITGTSMAEPLPLAASSAFATRERTAAGTPSATGHRVRGAARKSRTDTGSTSGCSKRCGTTPTRRPCESASVTRPSKATSPSTACSTVLLPAPLGPTSACRLPRATASDTPLTRPGTVRASTWSTAPVTASADP